MNFTEGILWGLGRTDAALRRAFDGLTADQVARRPCESCNSIGSIVIHLGRVMDTWTHRLVGGDDIWETEGWAEKLGLPANDRGWTYDKQSSENQKPLSELLGYYQGAFHLWALTVETFPEGRLTDPVESPLDLNVEQILAHVITELNQHVGQIDYMRGMYRSNIE